MGGERTTALPQRAGVYCRLSYAPDGSLEKVEQQESDCRELAVRLRWPISEQHIYLDNSRSAWQRNRKRPRWDAMLAAIEAGEIDSIIVYHGDRLIRQPYDLELLLNIAREKGIRLASPSGTRDLDSADDRFILRIEAAQACRESDNISRRQKRGWRSRVTKKGRAQSAGRRPYGWGAPTGRTRIKVDRVTGEETEVPVLDYNAVVSEEAAHLREAAVRLLAGLSVAGAVRYLNSVGTTTQGNPWTSRVVRSALTSPRIVGMIELDGVLHDAAWDPVISLEQWEGLKALFTRNKETSPNPGPARVHLLSGVAECGPCDGGCIRTKPMGGRKRPKTEDRGVVYHCRICNKVARNARLLDAYVEGRVLALLADPRFLDELHAPDGSEPSISAEIAALEDRKALVTQQLEQLADHPTLDAGLAVQALGSFDAKIAQLRARLATTAEHRLLTRMVGITREQWAAEPIDIRTATVRALFRIIILPSVRRGPGFDPDRVQLIRRTLSASAPSASG